MTIIEPTEFSQIVSIIDAGAVVALPTDTIYGLVCKYDYQASIAKIYQIKKRSPAKALPILVANWQQATTLGIFDEHLIRYLEHEFAAGQVTVVVRKQALLNKIAYWQQWDTVAIRVTKDTLLQEIINTIGPLAGTSCNVSGQAPLNDSRKINLPFLEYVVQGKILNPKSSIIYDSINKKVIRSQQE